MPVDEKVQVELRPARAAGPASAGRAVLRRFSSAVRLAWAAGFAVGGLLGALFFLPVPIMHLCTTWALPLAGAVAAFHALATEVAVKRIEGPCPHCQQALQLDGGSGPGPHLETCNACRKTIEVALVEPAPPT